MDFNIITDYYNIPTPTPVPAPAPNIAFIDKIMWFSVVGCLLNHLDSK